MGLTITLTSTRDTVEYLSHSERCCYVDAHNTTLSHPTALDCSPTARDPACLDKFHRFFDLPAELRQLIYAFAFESPEDQLWCAEGDDTAASKDHRPGPRSRQLVGVQTSQFIEYRSMSFDQRILPVVPLPAIAGEPPTVSSGFTCAVTNLCTEPGILGASRTIRDEAAPRYFRDRSFVYKFDPITSSSTMRALRNVLEYISYIHTTPDKDYFRVEALSFAAWIGDLTLDRCLDWTRIWSEFGPRLPQFCENQRWLLRYHVDKHDTRSRSHTQRPVSDSYFRELYCTMEIMKDLVDLAQTVPSRVLTSRKLLGREIWQALMQRPLPGEDASTFLGYQAIKKQFLSRRDDYVMLFVLP